MINTDEETQRVCHYCKVSKIWIFSGKKQKDGTKIYIDSRNQRWSGRRCPDCEKQRVQSSLRWDYFERELIEKKLTEQGFNIIKRTPPIKVEKDGEIFSVGIRHAATQNGKIILEPSSQPFDLHVLVFSSIRVCSPEQIKNLEPQTILHSRSKSISTPDCNSPMS